MKHPVNELIDSAFYPFEFYKQALPRIFFPQNIRLLQKQVIAKNLFVLTADNQKKWFELFDAKNMQADIPFTFYWPHCVLAFLQTIKALGAHYKNILHLKCSINFLARNPKSMQLGALHGIKTSFNSIIPLSSSKAVFTGNTLVLGPYKKRVAQLTDTILVKNISTSDMKKIGLSPLCKKPKNLDDYLTKRTPTFTQNKMNYREHTLFFPMDMGLKFGDISGDLNPIHLTTFSARLFGYKKPFIQGLCTANAVIKKFFVDESEDLKKMDITFVKPIFLGEKVFLRFNKKNYEIVGKNDELLAFGERG
ncbi:hypothetical protein K1X76_06610 [bacterium]|nr:hypothetical protein [bacterium]